MNIAIIERQNDLEQALSYYSPDDAVFLSVSAEASYYMSKQNIDYFTDEEVLSPEEFKALGDDNFKITEKWVTELEKRLLERNPIIEKEQFQPFKWHFYRLKILVDAVRIRKVLLEKLIEKEQPYLIIAPVAARPGEIHDHHLFFQKDDSLYGLIIEKIAKTMGIEVKNWKQMLVKRSIHAGDGMTVLKSVLRNTYRQMRALTNIRRSKNRKTNMLMGSVDYDIYPLKENMVSLFNYFYYEEPLGIRSLNSFKKLSARSVNGEHIELDTRSNFRAIAVTGDPVIDEILGERIESFTVKCVPMIWRGWQHMKFIDSRKHFKGYFHPAGASDAFFGIPVYYFKKQKKPVFVVQHGSYGFAINKMTLYSEFGHDGYFFAWGDGVREMYDSIKKGKCEIVSTGSHLIEEIRKKKKRTVEIKKVCYVPGTYRGYTAYYPNGQPCLDSKLFVMETRFLSTLIPYVKRYEITYKVAPTGLAPSPIFGFNPMVDWVKENIPGIQINSKPLLSVIHDYDLFIIDWPTTTLVQAIASGAEVIVYSGNPYHFLKKDAVEMLKKRALIGINEEDFKGKIRMVLERGNVVSDIEHTGFLKKYGVYLDDGKSLKRMTDKVASIISK